MPGRLPLVLDRYDAFGLLVWSAVLVGSAALSAFTTDPDLTGFLRCVFVGTLVVFVLILSARRWPAVRTSRWAAPTICFGGAILLAIVAVALGLDVRFRPEGLLPVALVATVSFWASVLVLLVVPLARRALSYRVLGLFALGTVVAWGAAFAEGASLRGGRYPWDVLVTGAGAGLIASALLLGFSHWTRGGKEKFLRRMEAAYRSPGVADDPGSMGSEKA